MALTPEQRARARRITATAQAAFALVVGREPGEIVDLSPEEMTDTIATLLYAAGLAAHIGLVTVDEAFFASAAIDALRSSKKHADQMIAEGWETKGNA